MNEEQTQDVETQPTEAQTPATPVSEVSSQQNGSMPTDLPPEAPESPISDAPHYAVPQNA